MKPASLKTCLIGLIAASCAWAATPETLLDMDMTKVKGNNIPKWANNQAVNKNAIFTIKKDENGRPYLQTKGWTHYFYSNLLPVNETDTFIVSLRARGKGMVTPGFYIFDALDGFNGVYGKRLQLTPEWKTHTVTLKLKNTKGKTTAWRYPGYVRPLIDSSADDIQFADYSLKILRDPVLLNWHVDMKQSTGDVKAMDGFVSLPDLMVYDQEGKLTNATEGDQVTFTFKIRGKGNLQAGFYAYDLKYDKRWKNNAKRFTEILQSQDIMAVDWKTITLTIPVKNFKKNQETYYTNRIQPLFKTKASKDSPLELKLVEAKFEKEDLELPDF